MCPGNDPTHGGHAVLDLYIQDWCGLRADGDSYYQFIREKINDAAGRPSHVCKKNNKKTEETCGVKNLESPETECTIYSPTVLVCKLWDTSLDCLNVKPLYTPSEFQFQVCFQMMLIVSGDRRWSEANRGGCSSAYSSIFKTNHLFTLEI